MEITIAICHRYMSYYKTRLVSKLWDGEHDSVDRDMKTKTLEPDLFEQ